MTEVVNTPSASGRHQGRLTIALVLTAAYVAAEVAAGLVTGSLALIADAAHMLTDAFGLGLTLFAIWLSARPATPTRTYGYYRTEILAALANALVLFAVSGAILYEAWRRFQSPPEVQSLPMLAVAFVGMLINLTSAWLLREGAAESLNVQGAFLEVVSDFLGSLAVIAAGLIMHFTGWYYADPLFSVLIGLFIVPRTWHLVNETVGILLEGTPSHLSLAQVRAVMEAVPSVVSVHDLHVWSITSGYVAVSAHARVAPTVDRMGTLQALRRVLQEQFQIEHATIQLEEPGYDEASTHP